MGVCFNVEGDKIEKCRECQRWRWGRQGPGQVKVNAGASDLFTRRRAVQMDKRVRQMERRRGRTSRRSGRVDTMVS